MYSTYIQTRTLLKVSFKSLASCTNNHPVTCRPQPTYSFTQCPFSWEWAGIVYSVQQITRLSMGHPGLEPQHSHDSRLFSKTSTPEVGPTQTPVQWIPQVFFFFLGGGGLMIVQSHVDPSPPSSSELKNGWKYTSTPTYMLWRRRRGFQSLLVSARGASFLPC
jgi:hypothetical protein